MKLQLTLLVLILLVACGSGGDGNYINPISKDKLSEFQSCAIDSDCTIAQNGCCDCANGGQDVAINKSQVENFRGLFNCDAILCTALGALPPCGSGKVECLSEMCVFTAPDRG